MSPKTSHYADIVVQTRLAHTDTTEQSRYRATRRGADDQRIYDALVYTNLRIPWLRPSESHTSDQHASLGGLPLAAVEQIVVQWGRYKEYLAEFFKGDQAPDLLRTLLFDMLSPGLDALFGGEPLSEAPVRVWWANMAPELEELPWEIAAYAHRSPTDEQFSFVRGNPPATLPPQVPIAGQLRLAFIHNPQRTPEELRAALATLSESLEVIEMTGPPRAALERAAHEHYELIHLVADGSVSLACEGVLELFEGRASKDKPAKAATCSPYELNAMLRGSSAVVLGLSPSKGHQAKPANVSKSSIPMVYRAFAHFASAQLPLPSILAPVAPLPHDQEATFWQYFYRKLAETRGIEAAVAQSRFAVSGLQIALFLRHPHMEVFRRIPVSFSIHDPEASVPPAQLDAELQLSQEVVRRLSALATEKGLPQSVEEFIKQESAHQDKLSNDLAPWRSEEN
jgi:hypothetical protein